MIEFKQITDSKTQYPAREVAQAQLQSCQKQLDDYLASLTEEKVIYAFCIELYSIWQEAKSTEVDNWDDQDYNTLPDKHKAEYKKTAKHLLSIVAPWLAKIELKDNEEE